MNAALNRSIISKKAIILVSNLKKKKWPTEWLTRRKERQERKITLLRLKSGNVCRRWV
jgi:hypothetical protein